MEFALAVDIQIRSPIDDCGFGAIVSQTFTRSKMLTKIWGRTLVALLVVLCPLSSAVFGRGTDLSFRGTVTMVESTPAGSNSVGTGTVSVRAVGFDIPVQVNAETDIESHGDKVGIDGIAAGQFVKVSGFFSAAGIFAKEIQILDKADNEFRLRGSISNIRRSASETTITVLGVDVLVNTDTKIERRGPDGGFTAGELAVGMQVDTRGAQQDDKLVATRVKVGNREDDAVEIRFEGTITSISSDKNELMVDTAGGGTAVVLKTAGTKLKGTLAVGTLIEVKGTLNKDLAVVADTIKADGVDVHEAKEKEKQRPENVRKEIKLSPPADAKSTDGLKGSASITYKKEGTKVDQEFEVEIEKADPKAEYSIGVHIAGMTGPAEFGKFKPDSKGNIKVKFSTSPKGTELGISTLLPTGRDVRDLGQVQIFLNGQVVLERSF